MEPQPRLEQPKPSKEPKPADQERWKNLVLILTVVATVSAALVAALQVDAGLRANQASRDAQLCAIQLADELQQRGLRSNYELTRLATITQDRLEANVLELTALKLKDKNDKPGAANATLQAQAAKARAAKGQATSLLYTDPRYAPASADGQPNVAQYLKDAQAQEQTLRQQQTSTIDAYSRWSKKANAYVGVWVVLAVALFLLGLAQGVAPRLRLLFAVVGVLAVGAASLWTLTTLLF